MRTAFKLAALVFMFALMFLAGMGTAVYIHTQNVQEMASLEMMPPSVPMPPSVTAPAPPAPPKPPVPAETGITWCWSIF